MEGLHRGKRRGERHGGDARVLPVTIALPNARLGAAQRDLIAELVRDGLDSLAAAAGKVRREIAKLPDGVHRFADRLDDGTPICAALHISGERMVVDFAGTGAASPGNLNAPRSVVRAAVLYVLRCLVAERIPLCGGCLEPVEIRIPPGSLLLENDSLAPHLGELDPRALTYRWTHPDPEMDRLQEKASVLVEEGVALGRSNHALFHDLAELAAVGEVGGEEFLRTPTRPPRLSEAWFC